MNIIAVDDEQHALNSLKKAIMASSHSIKLNSFLSVNEALDYACGNRIDVAFLDIEMAGMNGIELAKRLKEICSLTNIIFVTGFSSYAVDAFSLHASGYILKPIDPAQVQNELDRLREPVTTQDAGLRVQCFGNFEVFYNGKPLLFKRAKSKEAFAYLIDRKGASVTKKELAAVILGDEPYTRSTQSYVHIIISEMLNALENVNVYDVIIKERNSYSVNVKNVYCDYYEFEKGEIDSINRYMGEYMTNYSWAEFTVGKLNRYK